MTAFTYSAAFALIRPQISYIKYLVLQDKLILRETSRFHFFFVEAIRGKVRRLIFRFFLRQSEARPELQNNVRPASGKSLKYLQGLAWDLQEHTCMHIELYGFM